MSLSLQAEYVCRHCVEIIGCLAVLVSISVKLLVVMMLIVPTGTVAITLLTRYVGRVSLELQDALAKVSVLYYD
jgi:ABC-type multidrug transport system fused ATPase/permease subunit